AGDAGTRGWVAALDVKTGNELWRFYVVPKPGDPGRESWRDDHNAWKPGGGVVGKPGPPPPRPIFKSPAPATRTRFTTRSSGPATISTRIQSSRSTWPTASLRGTSSTRPTIRGTTRK